ncbi:hypothetical protein SAMN05444161_8016 [Rhizobiales bacterium GAS191]|nr:hypothetical protein SAMN05519103_07308 [Rhizobiales bacterium GAS113]SEE94376.1 hypothetical protein SAMN05444161_8016 [Rhizobiales bacterium GAS191]
MDRFDARPSRAARIDLSTHSPGIGHPLPRLKVAKPCLHKPGLRRYAAAFHRLGSHGVLPP